VIAAITRQKPYSMATLREKLMDVLAADEGER